MKYLVIMLKDCGDLYKYEFDTREEADKFLEENEWKAYLVEIEGSYKIENHT